jgi:hypothetical protein
MVGQTWFRTAKFSAPKSFACGGISLAGTRAPGVHFSAEDLRFFLTSFQRKKCSWNGASRADKESAQ